MKLAGWFGLVLISSVAGTGCMPRQPWPAGGYPYPAASAVVDPHFYRYPLRDKLTRIDSFRTAFAYLSYQEFDEPNLSTAPGPTETIRLHYATAFNDHTIIVLTPGQITVKSGNPSNVYVPEEELAKQLSKEELEHYRLLSRRFPVEDTAGKKPAYKRFIDSMTKRHPQLTDVGYYIALTRKMVRRTGEKCNYRYFTRPITACAYGNIISAINRSGYWSMPLHTACPHPPADGDGFSLEANTRHQYNYVSVAGCTGDTSAFTQACQQIIRLAGLHNKINLVSRYAEVVPAGVEPAPMLPIEPERPAK